MGIDWMDEIGLRDPERLEAVVARHPHVLATLVGHLHSAAASTFGLRPMLVGGGIASTVTVPGEGLPDLWYDIAPSYALHLVTDDLRLVTHWRSL